jgi:hypothetical protein
VPQSNFSRISFQLEATAKRMKEEFWAISTNADSNTLPIKLMKY